MEDAGEEGRAEEEAATDAAFAHLRGVALAAWFALKQGGLLLMEHGWNQGAPLGLWLARQGWEEIRQHQDLAGKDRVIGARKPGAAGRTA